MSEEDLLKGAWYALEQAGILMESAVLLYDAGQWSTAVGVAMLGREELGRSRILRDFATEATTRSVSVGEVRARCEKHREKQAKAIGSHVFKPPRDSALGKAITTLSEEPASSSKAAAADRVIEDAVKAERRRLPQERHEQRMQAFYVDVRDSGEWVRRVTIAREKAHDVVQHAVNDYAGPFHNLNIESHAPEMTRVRNLMVPPPQLRSPRWPGRATETRLDAEGEAPSAHQERA